MAGEAVSNAFLLQSASLLLGPKDDLFLLNDAAHSVGLVKNIQITNEPSYTELTQGVKNNIVDSVMTKNTSRATMEVYEYTAKNLMYSLGLDGSVVTATGADHAPASNIAPAATTATITADVTTTFGAGDWVEISQGNDSHIVKLTSAAYTSSTLLTFTGYAVPAGLTFVAATTKIRKVRRIDVGSIEDQPYLSAKMVFGKMSDGKPMTILFPKIRITKGFNLNSQTDNYSNMPFEFTPYQITAADSSYAKFVSSGLGLGNAYVYRAVA